MKLDLWKRVESKVVRWSRYRHTVDQSVLAPMARALEPKFSARGGSRIAWIDKASEMNASDVECNDMR